MNAKTLKIINTMKKVIQNVYMNLLKILGKVLVSEIKFVLIIHPLHSAFIHLLMNIHTASKATRRVKE